jgi:hypothetical protein
VSSKKQFAAVENPGFWHWTFTLRDQNQGVLAEIDRNWRGFGYEFLTDAGQYVIRFGDILPKDIHPASPVLDEDVQNRKPLLSSTQGQSGAQEMQQLQAAATEVSPHILLGEPTLNGNGFCPLQKSAALHHPAFVSEFWGFSFPDVYKSCPFTTMQCNRR